MAARTWTCQRVTDGIKCGSVNPKRNLICKTCGKRRPVTKREAHFSVLDLPYEVFVAANGGLERCGICGAQPSPDRKLDRDHEHKGDGLVRGVLCHSCNRTLGPRMESSARQGGMTLAQWLRAAAGYVERAERLRWINWPALATIPSMSESPQQPQPQQPDPNQDPQPAQQPDQAPQDPNQPQQDPSPQQPEPTTTQGG